MEAKPTPEVALFQAAMESATGEDPLAALVHQAEALKGLGEIRSSHEVAKQVLSLIEQLSGPDVEQISSSTTADLRRFLEELEPLDEQSRTGVYPSLKTSVAVEGAGLTFFIDAYHEHVPALADWIHPALEVDKDRNLVVTRAGIQPGELLLVLNPVVGFKISQPQQHGDAEAMSASAASSWRFQAGLELNRGASVWQILEKLEGKTQAAAPEVFTIGKWRGVWPIVGSIARSCCPNVAGTIETFHGAIFVRATAVLEPGKELLLSEPGIDPTTDLVRRPGSCDCPKCLLDKRYNAAVAEHFLSAESRVITSKHEELMEMLHLNQAQRDMLRCTHHYLYMPALHLGLYSPSPPNHPAAGDLLKALACNGLGGFRQNWFSFLFFQAYSDDQAEAASIVHKCVVAWFGEVHGSHVYLKFQEFLSSWLKEHPRFGAL